MADRDPRLIAPTEDREPQPSDGPDFHAQHAAWRERQAKRNAPSAMWSTPSEVPSEGVLKGRGRTPNG